ncbi:MAG: hypothetical protein ACO1QS_16255 [Verrucomicrobiota bacterium]
MTAVTSALVLSASMAMGVEGGGNPYADIVTRNAFGLKPPEPPKAPEPPKEEVAPSNIFMTGVTSIGGKKQVYLKLVTPGEKEPKYLRLGENERDGAIEVTEIIPKTGRVRIKNRGVPSTISFETHGSQMSMAAPAAPAMAGRPGVPPPPGGMPSAPGVVSTSPGVSVPAKPGASTLPVSPNNTAINTSSSGAAPATLYNNQPSSTQPASSPTQTRTIPSRQLRIGTTGGGATYVAPSNPEVPGAKEAGKITPPPAP